MAKGDAQKARTAVTNQRDRQTGQQDQIYNEMMPAYVNSRADDQRTRSEIEDRYRSFKPEYDINSIMGTGNPLATEVSRTSSGGGGGGTSKGSGGINLQKISGGIDPNMIRSMGAEPYSGYKKMSEGLRPEFWADFNKYMGGLDTAMGTVTEAADKYRDFSNTGGYSSQDLDAIRASGMAPLNSIYRKAEDDLTRLKSRTGGSGYGYLKSKMDLDRARAATEGAVQTEGGIAERVAQGKQFGTQGLEHAGISQAQIGQMQTQARTQVEELDQQMRAQGLGGMTDIEKSRLSAHLTNQQITQQGQIATNQGILGKAQIEEARRARGSASSAAAAARAEAARQFDTQMRFGVEQARNRDLLASQTGWTDLYGTAPGATALTGNQLLGLQNQGASQNMGLIDRQIQATQIPGDYSQALGNIGGTMGLMGQIGSAVSGIRGILPMGQNPYDEMRPY